MPHTNLPYEEVVLVDFLEGEPSVVAADPAFSDEPDPEEGLQDMDPSVPEDLLEIHMALEDSDMDVDGFKEVFG